ncbi:MAG TPA: hypothetical protein VLU99_05045 [Nitrososphaerales archaeon]|nr:hypothetical protein [Nitrososphaerales archaeon]
MVARYSARRSRPALGTAAWAAVLVVVALAGVASVLVVEEGGAASQHSSTSVTSSMSTTASTSMTSTSSAGVSSTSATSAANGLELFLGLNASSVSAGQWITATVVETNTLTTPNNVSAAAEWPVANLAAGPCGHMNEPVGIAVLRGNYDAGNVTSGSALQVYQPGVTMCPMILAAITGYLFQPASDNASVLGSCQSGPCFNETISASVSASGYWTGTGSALTNFPAGVYTVVAGDEWGGVAIVHFTVK